MKKKGHPTITLTVVADGSFLALVDDKTFEGVIDRDLDRGGCLLLVGLTPRV